MMERGGLYFEICGILYDFLGIYDITILQLDIG